MTKPPDWEETLDDLARRRQHTWAMGGPERLTKHRGKGKLEYFSKSLIKTAVSFPKDIRNRA